MSSQLQFDVRHLNRRKRHLVNAYEAKAGAFINCRIIIIIFLTLVLNSQERKIMLCKDKIRKQAGMVFTPPPSQNYQEVE